MLPNKLKFSRRAAGSCLAILLLVCFALLCRRSAADTSPAYDEPGHILAGYSYWNKTGPEIATANLRAAQLWLALPLTTLPLHVPASIKQTPGLVVEIDAKVCRDFLYDARHDPGEILRLSRGAITVLGLLLGAVLFLWARRVFGQPAALATLGLYCFEPTIIAHSALATTDIAVTLMFTLALAGWWRLIHEVTTVNTLLCGLVTGVLAATKLSAALLFPAVAVMLVARLVALKALRAESATDQPRTERPWRAFLAASFAALLIACVVIWGIYGFHYTRGWPMTESAWLELAAPNATWARRSIDFLRVHHLLPEAYIYDMKWFLNTAAGRRAYLLGDFSVEGWWTYFPVAVLAKTSLPTLLALALALPAAGLALVRRKELIGWYHCVPLVAFAAIYAAVALASPMNLGLRHFLPVYPALFLVAGYGVSQLAAMAGRAAIPLTAVLIGWAATVAWNASPYFLAYFNPAAGGTARGHRVLVESNLDWGQDLPKISRWLKARTSAPRLAPQPVFFSYYGLGDPAYYGIRARMLPQEPDYRPVSAYALTSGTYVISATFLQGLAGQWVWGPWRPSLERTYRSLKTEVARFYLPTDSEGKTGGAQSLTDLERQKIALFDGLRFARLCAYLRLRPPTERITPAIFVFDLHAADLATALEGPPPFTATTEIKGLARLPAIGIEFLR